MHEAARNDARGVPGAAASPLVSALVLALVSALAPAPSLAQGDDLESRVKAEFVERFTHFIDWPPAAFASADAPFVVCVIGDTPVTSYLEAMARARRIKDRPAELRRLGRDADLSRCHVVFIAADERSHLAKILAGIGSLPILTIADAEGFGRAGVLINLVVDDNGRVRFDISSSGARRTALTFHAQLLKLSRHGPESD